MTEKKLSKLFTMKVGEEDLKKYHDLAKSYDIPLARLIKNFLDGQDLPEQKKISPRKIPKADPKLIRQVAAIGNNLNQISRKLNRGEKLNVLPVLLSMENSLKDLIS